VSPAPKYETHTHDVIVIGAGGAGLRAAIEASAQGLSVGLVCKSLLGKAHTVMAEGGAAAAMGNVDSADGWKTHFMDTLKGGKFLNNWRMAQIHATEAPERIKELERWGAVFDRTSDGKIMQRPFGGHSYRRLCHVGDRTGLELIRTLQDKGVHSGIQVYMECTVTRLLKEENKLGSPVTGALGYWRESGRFVLFNAKSIILATGGIGKAYKITSNSWEYTGDGHNLAYKAGAELMDMEFLQFHPTGMVWPPGVKGLLITEAVRGEGGLLTNNLGERFMKDYDPARMELSTRDIVAKAIDNEVKQGRGSEHGGVYLDISHRDADFVKKKLPSMYHQFKELADVDITTGPMEVGPTMHYTMGGLKVDPETAQTKVPGLFAAGEVAAGLHGANRLGGNSLSDLLVFGRRAGLGAVAYANARGAMPAMDETQIALGVREALAPFERETDDNPYAIHRDLQNLMHANVGIIREEEALKEAIHELQTTFRQRVANVSVTGACMFNPGWHLAMDLESMVMTSEAVAVSALLRRESRGGHTRIEFPEYDPVLSKVNSKIHRDDDGSMVLEQTPLPELPEELAGFFS
jgi:succinate dehydrogenase / fumarate reductase, flavoprotein subunit